MLDLDEDNRRSDVQKRKTPVRLLQVYFGKLVSATSQIISPILK